MSIVKKTGVDQGSLVAILQALRNKLTANPGLTTGLTTSVVKNDFAFDTMIDGRYYAGKAADVDFPTMSALTDTGAGERTVVRVEIDSAGTITYVQGPITATGTTKYPPRSAAKATVGYAIAGASFNFGTDSVAGLTIVSGDPDLETGLLIGAGDLGLES